MRYLAAQYIYIAAFILLPLYGIYRVVRFVRFLKASRATVSEGASGKALHISTPRGGVDVQVHQTRDAGLESIPKYPRAMPIDSRPESEMQIHAPGREGRFVERMVWSADPFDVVEGYYKREFSNWKKDRYFMVGEPLGCRYEEQIPGCIRTIEIRSDGSGMVDARNFREARTVITYSVLYGDRLPTLPTR
jgi:hypothetical protein